MSLYRFERGRVVRHDRPARSPNTKETAMSPGDKSVRISMGQRLRLFDWLRAKREELQKTRPRFDHAATRISKELGFEINRNVLVNALKALEWRWTPGERGASRSGRANREMIRILKRQNECLRQAIFNLVERIGEQPPSMICSEEWPVLDMDADPKPEDA